MDSCKTISSFQQAIQAAFDAKLEKLRLRAADVEVVQPDWITIGLLTADDVSKEFPVSFLGKEALSRWARCKLAECDEVKGHLISMLTGVAKMIMRNEKLLSANGSKTSFVNDKAWKQCISNHLQPFSTRAPAPGKSIDDKLASNQEMFWADYQAGQREENEIKIRAAHKKLTAKRSAMVSDESMSLILNLMPHKAIDALWLHHATKNDMEWLREDMEEHCMRVQEHFMSRTWIDQSNVLCFLDQFRSPDTRTPLSAHLVQKIARMAMSQKGKDLPIRLPKVDSRLVLSNKLVELGNAAASLPLHQVRAHLKRLYESIGEEEDSSNKKKRDN